MPDLVRVHVGDRLPVAPKLGFTVQDAGTKGGPGDDDATAVQIPPIGIGEVRMIEDIENIRSELHLQPLRYLEILPIPERSN